MRLAERGFSLSLPIMYSLWPSSLLCFLDRFWGNGGTCEFRYFRTVPGCVQSVWRSRWCSDLCWTNLATWGTPPHLSSTWPWFSIQGLAGGQFYPALLDTFRPPLTSYPWYECRRHIRTEHFYIFRCTIMVLKVFLKWANSACILTLTYV